MSIYLVVILVILVGTYLLDVVVKILNLRHQKSQLPAEFIGFCDAQKYSRSQQYTRENTKFGLVYNTAETLFTIAFILLAGFNFFDQWARGFHYGPILTGLIYAFGLLLLAGLLNLPFEIYDTFVIEEKYGFNRTTVKTFILDLVKNMILLGVIGAPMLALVLWFFRETGRAAPLYIWGAVTLFQLFMVFIAPVVIFPLFNKFYPLEEGELKEAIEKYIRQQRFPFRGIYKMDGSRRSSRANAFFTGFGRTRRIVLYDTLIDKHTTDELVVTLAHEIGHYRLRHFFKLTAANIVETGLMFFLLSLFINNRPLFAAFGMEQLSVYASLIFFGFLYTPISTLISIVMNIFSRRHEYQADAFALRTTGKGEDLITTLKKLAVDQLDNLTPHPLKVFLSYSHPPVLQRIKAIRAAQVPGGAAIHTSASPPG